MCQLGGDDTGAARWKRRFPGSKFRQVKQLETSDHGNMMRAVDPLVPFRGLWGGKVTLGTLNRTLGLRCFEVRQRKRR